MDPEAVLAWAKETYGTEPDRPWRKYPEYLVLRHAESRKWYGLIMHLGRTVLSPGKTGDVWVLNVRCRPGTGALWRSRGGIYPGYHMNHDSWLSVCLDDTVEDEIVTELLRESYELTKPRLRRKVEETPAETPVSRKRPYKEDF